MMMMMKKLILLASLLLASATAFGWAGEWQNDDRIKAIKAGKEAVFDVKLEVYNMADEPAGRKACGDKQCYRVDVFVNEIQIATWATSPGRPQSDGGIYSPIYNGHNILTHYGRNYVSYRKKYNMRYAMYIERKSQPGKISNVAFHGKYKVTGKRESHGCFRMRDSEVSVVNSFVRKAFKNGGSARVWSEGTRPPFKK